jgi:hypothetical protein
VNCSVGLIAIANHNITSNAGNFSVHLADAKAEDLSNLLVR